MFKIPLWAFIVGELTKEISGYRVIAVSMPKMQHEYLNNKTNLCFSKRRFWKLVIFKHPWIFASCIILLIIPQNEMLFTIVNSRNPAVNWCDSFINQQNKQVLCIFLWRRQKENSTCQFLPANDSLEKDSFHVDEFPCISEDEAFIFLEVFPFLFGKHI